MNTMTLDAWCKPDDVPRSIPIGMIHFHLSDEEHLRLEQAEDLMQGEDCREKMLPLDMSQLELEVPEECGALSDCQLRVYISPENERGHFHLVGHRESDGSLVYTNSVMVDQLG